MILSIKIPVFPLYIIGLLELVYHFVAVVVVSRVHHVCPIVKSHVLLLQYCDVIENSGIGNNAAIPLVEKFKLLLNNDRTFQENIWPQPH